MKYELTETEAEITAMCLSEIILMVNQHNLKHTKLYYSIINVIVKLQGIECNESIKHLKL